MAISREEIKQIAKSVAAKVLDPRIAACALVGVEFATYLHELRQNLIDRPDDFEGKVSDFMRVFMDRESLLRGMCGIDTTEIELDEDIEALWDSFSKKDYDTMTDITEVMFSKLPLGLKVKED